LPPVAAVAGECRDADSRESLSKGGLNLREIERLSDSRRCADTPIIHDRARLTTPKWGAEE
jgi:hypothetical protein